MSTPTGDEPFLHDLELTVRAELEPVERGRPEEDLDRPIGEWLVDPTDVQREDAELHSLLDAVEVLEGEYED